MPILTADEWDAFITQHPDAHILQSGPWGELKASFGWEVVRVSAGNNEGVVGVQILLRKLPLGFSLAYIPKGPLMAANLVSLEMPGWGLLEELWVELDRLCRQKRSVLLKLEPDLLSDQVSVIPLGFRASPHAIQPLRTILVDLTGSEEDLLARMKQKTRYNIRLAQKKGVRVTASTDIDAYYQLMQVTGDRDGFAIHSPAYYRRAQELFGNYQACQLLLAQFEGENLAGLMVFAQGKRAWYFYGASSGLRRELMPTYVLQWEAMRWARARGCTQYDLWGVPDETEQTLESNFEARADGLWGVYRFKRGFGGRLVRAAGPWDRVYNPALYQGYLWWARRGGLSG